LSRIKTQENAPRPIEGKSGENLAHLTNREQEVCKLLAYGYTNAEVGRKLVISERTVECHRANILNKLSIRRRSELVRFAIEHRLLRRTFD
jgi:two-component system response regulator NreC